MSDKSRDYASGVNSVIAICKDAEEGFHGAANAVKDPDLKAVFEQHSTQRAAFAAELHDELGRCAMRWTREPRYKGIPQQRTDAE